MKEIYEKVGLFYMGRDVDPKSRAELDLLTLLKNKNFTTHAAIIGMTGSGKTGLGIGLIEEATLDNIPSLIIDPKGDMGNLLLTDPHFSAHAFEPWLEHQAKEGGEDTSSLAHAVASQWEAGLEASGQDRQRVERFHQVTKTIYTPGGSAGVGINILSSLGVPSLSVMEDREALSSYLKSTVTSLLSFVGIMVDSLETKEYSLLSQIILASWLKDEALSIEQLIGKILNPPFTRIGVLELELFYPQQARFTFATKFNALLANPSFSLWMQGESLDIQKLLYDEQGRAKVAIFSIAHLNDQERMFFVTLLLNHYIAWMRQGSGTTRLKTLLYMDEIYGFFPPTKNPPSKEPMLLLLKQARAFGVGVILSTQNPIDLDYKGLSNIGTWFIGRLQTTQDIDRVIEGLEGKRGSTLSRQEIKEILSSLKKRTFLLKSVHLEDIRLFSTRWVMSYLKGPLGKREISTLMQSQKLQDRDVLEHREKQSLQREYFQGYQLLDRSIPQYYELDTLGSNRYHATLGAKVTMHFINQRKGIDEKRHLTLSLPLEATEQSVRWENAIRDELDFERFPHTIPSEAQFSTLPSIVVDDKGLRRAIRELKASLYQEETLSLFRSTSPKLESLPHESYADFMVRLQAKIAEQKEQEIAKLMVRYETKEQRLLSRLSRAKERVAKERSDATSSMLEAGIALLGALFGRSSISKVGRAVSRGGRVLKERQDMSRAEERMAEIEEAIEALQYELEEKLEYVDSRYSIERIAVDKFNLKARKTDIDVVICAVVWRVF